MSLVDYEFESEEEELLEAAAAEKANWNSSNSQKTEKRAETEDLGQNIQKCLLPVFENSVDSSNIPTGDSKTFSQNDDWPSGLSVPLTADWSGLSEDGADQNSSDASTDFGSETKWNPDSSFNVELSSQLTVFFDEMITNTKIASTTNPYLMETIMKRYGIDSYRSNLPPDIFDSVELRSNREEYDAYVNGTLRRRLRRRSRTSLISGQTRQVTSVTSISSTSVNLNCVSACGVNGLNTSTTDTEMVQAVQTEYSNHLSAPPQQPNTVPPQQPNTVLPQQPNTVLPQEPNTLLPQQPNTLLPVQVPILSDSINISTKPSAFSFPCDVVIRDNFYNSTIEFDSSTNPMVLNLINPIPSTTIPPTTNSPNNGRNILSNSNGSSETAKRHYRSVTSATPNNRSDTPNNDTSRDRQTIKRRKDSSRLSKWDHPPQLPSTSSLKSN